MTAREVSEVPGLRDALVTAFREREKESAFCEFSAPLDCEDAANVALAALRTLLTEHPALIAELGWKPVNEVWVADGGAYSDRWTEGIYISAQRAIDANPVPVVEHLGHYERSGGWQQDADATWGNGLDYDRSMTVAPMELTGGPVFAPPISEEREGK